VPLLPPLSPFLPLYFSLSLSDVFQDITGHVASLLSTGHSDEAAVFILAAYTNLVEQRRILS
jgi:hypothetical protein